MLKLSAAILAVYAAMIGTASACISYDHSSNTFFSACDETMYVIYRTVGGGCYQTETGNLTLQAGASQQDDKLSGACGASDGWRVDWTWCEFDQWENGDCKPKF